MIDFLKFVNQSDEDKYNMLLEAQAIIHQLDKKWEMLKEKVNEGYRVYRNRGYDLVFEIDEVPKEQLNDFVCYLATQTMEALINKIEDKLKDSDVK